MDEPMERIQQLWPAEPTKDHLHICVRLPSAIGKRKPEAEDETERGKPPKSELHESDISDFSRIPSHKVQAAWDLYTNMWGQPLKDVVQTIHGQQNVLEYVPSEKLRKLGLKFLGFIEPNHRSQYWSREDLFLILCPTSPVKQQESHSVSNGCILFDDGGPQEFSRFQKQTVALADSTATGMEPSCVAFQDAAKAYVRVIQTTSPALDHSKGWYKEVSANQYVMDYSSSEMDVLGFICLFKRLLSYQVCPNRKILDLNCDVLQRIYNTWGPSTYNCVHLTRHPGQEGGYAGDVESAVRNFVKKFQHSPLYINPLAESPKSFPSDQRKWARVTKGEAA
ncbi:hypothetical protein EDB92DRAFT_1817835 [Lactarius akahatsu]|uniref:Uncharacterized protein n=1 Tax=Lactarius akahatsu TaxID=416441 RepID=A0AAD4LFE5_9AGAM|nr:hypothetical protein EDB92DRAFT_1817835 [Lactarius akahatsu]